MATLTYNAGTHSVVVAPGQTIAVELYGGGGGGGLGVHQNDQNKEGVNGVGGEATTMYVGSSNIAIAYGGGGGGRGWWDNGSAWKAGVGGEGGKVSTGSDYKAHAIQTGEVGHALRNDRIGGRSRHPDGYGKGGDGGNGYGNHSPADGWAAGGGAGGYARLLYTNKSAGNETITLNVGKGGARAAYGNYNKTPQPTSGTDGFATVTDLSDVLKHVNIVRTGVIKQGEARKIVKTAKEAFYDYTDTNKIGILICPEGEHEGWTITRSANEFNIDVFNRSGTSRIGYTGNISWMIFEVSDAFNKSAVVRTGVTNSGNFHIEPPLGMNLYDTSRYAVFITPEGGNEGWSTIRLNGGIDVNLFNRSGTGRVGYTGNVNWMVVDMQMAVELYPYIMNVGSSETNTVTIEGSDFEDIEECAVFTCPQGIHEAWYIGRTVEDTASAFIHNRSGTSRIGYTGLSYIMATVLTPDMDKNVYGVGYHEINVLPSQTIEIYAFGGGGGGGSSSYTSGEINRPGYNGEDTTVTIGDRIYRAGGGGGGGPGWWGNGSHMSEGGGGLKGVASVTGTLPSRVEEIEFVTQDGLVGYQQTWSPQYETPATQVGNVMSNNTGGEGGWGVGDESRAGGGSGGTGAGVKIRLANNSSVSVPIKLNIGKRGQANAGGNRGTRGGDGSVYVKMSDVSAVRKKDLTATLKVGGVAKGAATVEFLYTQAETGSTISIPDTYKKNHINLWEYFQEVNGRRPNAGEAITFIIPENRIFVAPFGYTSALREIGGATPTYSYVNERPFLGSAAVSLVGWDPSLNNKVTIDVRGKLIGSFNNPPTRSLAFMPYNKATGERLKWDTFKNFTGFPSVSAAWFWMHYLCSATFNSWFTGYPTGNTLQAFVMLDPIKNPAIQSRIDVKVIIRAGAYVIGGGGVQNARGIYSRTDVPSTIETIQGSVHDETNTNGGDAIVAETGANITVENYGYLSGGGGGGATVGVDVLDMVNADNGIKSQGGFAAPLGGVPLVEFPMYFDLEYIKTIPLYTMSGLIPSTALQTLAEDMMMDEASFQAHMNAKKGIDYTHARANASIDTTRIGHDANGDCVIDISKVRDAINNTNRFLSPTAGAQVSNIAGDLNVVSGSGGAPGVAGQMSTVVTGPAWLQAYPRVAGAKGVAMKRNSGGTFTYLEFPGSIINP